MTVDEGTARAVDLAERVLDEVSRPNQNWCKIAGWARELAALAAAAAERSAPGPTAEDG